MFKRKKSYPAVVAEAQEQAKGGNSITVFQQGKIFDWCESWFYPNILKHSNEPMIKLLICLPNGKVAQ